MCIHEIVASELYSALTSPDTDSWQTYTGPSPDESGLYVDIDYSSAGFSVPPVIQASLVGQVDNWVMQVTATEITPNTARIYIRSTLSSFAPTIENANLARWSVSLLMASAGDACTLDLTYYPVATDNA